MSQPAITRDDLAIPSKAQSAGASPVPPQRHSGFWRWLLSAIPTAAVVSTLAGLAIWGHTTDWTLPKFSALIGKELAETDDWCKEHNVPESQDIECHPELLPPVKDYGWCKEHGVAQCPLHHPDVAQLKTVPVLTEADFER